MASLRDDPRAARRVLDDRRSATLRTLEGSHEGDAAGLPEQAVAMDVERRRRLELARIDAALERLAAGEYGWCAGCGEPIPEARLDLDPAVALCVACAERRRS